MKEEEIQSGYKGVKYWMKTKSGGHVGASKFMEDMTVEELKKYKVKRAQEVADNAVESWVNSDYEGKLIDYIIKEKSNGN